MFTGDSLLIGGCGRIFKAASTLYDNITMKFGLPDDTIVFPRTITARTSSTVGHEKITIPTVAKAATIYALAGGLTFRPRMIDVAV